MFFRSWGERKGIKYRFGSLLGSLVQKFCIALRLMKDDGGPKTGDNGELIL